MCLRKKFYTETRSRIIDYGTHRKPVSWQGQISEVDAGIVCIDWDNITLANYPDKYIQRCDEEEGLDWERIYLSVEEVEKASQRDSDVALDKIRETIHRKHRWDYLGESGRRIHKIMKQANGTDEYAMLVAWEQYLNKKSENYRAVHDYNMWFSNK